MHILFLQAGGTIDKDYPRTVKGYGFEITGPSVMRILKKIRPSFSFDVKPILKKDSQDITPFDLKKIIDFCRKAKEDKIIITHGTDTIIETAKQLSVLKNKTIILTGAFLPEKFKDSDAEFNVGVAIGAISSVPRGAYVAMNGMVFSFDKVKRDPKTGRFIKK
jgi:L-asparaginase